MQVYVRVHGVFAAPARVPFADPHAVKAACGIAGTAKRRVTARIIGTLRKVAFNFFLAALPTDNGFVAFVRCAVAECERHRIKQRLINFEVRFFRRIIAKFPVRGVFLINRFCLFCERVNQLIIRLRGKIAVSAHVIRAVGNRNQIYVVCTRDINLRVCCTDKLLVFGYFFVFDNLF